MRMTAEPQGVLRRRYTVTADGAPITEIDFPPLAPSRATPSRATPIAGQRYRLRRSGVLRERFTLERDQAAQDGSRAIASATQRDPRRREFAVEAGERRLVLRAVSLLRSDYQLLDGEHSIGAIHPAGALHRGAEADFPDDLPLEVCVFLLWVVLLLWRGRRVTRAATSD